MVRNGDLLVAYVFFHSTISGYLLAKYFVKPLSTTTLPLTPVNSSKIGALTGETMPGKMNLHGYASLVSAETILKLPLKIIVLMKADLHVRDCGLM